MTIESMTTAQPWKVTGWKGLSDAAHFERLKTMLFRARERSRFDRAAVDRIMDDLRHVAYRMGVEAAQVFQFLDQDFIDANEDLSAAKDDLNRMSRNLPFIRELTAVVEEIESIRDEMREEARIFFGWRSYAGKWAFPNPVWSELRHTFQEGRDDAERWPARSSCPRFGHDSSAQANGDTQQPHSSPITIPCSNLCRWAMFLKRTRKISRAPSSTNPSPQ